MRTPSARALWRARTPAAAGGGAAAAAAPCPPIDANLNSAQYCHITCINIQYASKVIITEPYRLFHRTCVCPSGDMGKQAFDGGRRNASPDRILSPRRSLGERAGRRGGRGAAWCTRRVPGTAARRGRLESGRGSLSCAVTGSPTGLDPPFSNLFPPLCTGSLATVCARCGTKWTYRARRCSRAGG